MSVEVAVRLRKEAVGLSTSRFPPWGLTAKKEEAVEKWVKAAGVFKVHKQWDNAANCYQDAANLSLNYLKDESSAANYFRDAGNALLNAIPRTPSSDTLAVDLFLRAAKLHIQNNRMFMGGKLYVAAAQLEEKLGNVDKMIAHHQMAREIFTAEQSPEANASVLKIAEHRALMNDFKSAIDDYEIIIEKYLENRNLSFSARDYILNVMLCKFCMAISNIAMKQADVVHIMEQSSHQYKDKCPAFENSRESKFVDQLVQFYKENNYDKLNETIFQFDQIKRLDKLHIHLCLAIKTHAKNISTVASSAATPIAAATTAAVLHSEPDLR